MPGLRTVLSSTAPHDLMRFSTHHTTLREVDALSSTDPAVRAVSDQIRAMIRTGNLNPFSAIEIIRAATNIGADLGAVESIVEEIAKGADGVGGTADDLIPAATLEILKTLLRSGVVRDVVSWVADLLPVNVPDTPEEAKAACTKLFGRFRCFKSG